MEIKKDHRRSTLPRGEQEPLNDITFLPRKCPEHCSLTFSFRSFNFKKHLPLSQRRKKKAIQLLAIGSHHYSIFSSNFSSCHLPRAESCLFFATHFISIIIFHPLPMKSTQEKKKEHFNSCLVLSPSWLLVPMFLMEITDYFKTH